MTLKSGERVEADVVVCCDGVWVPERIWREKMLEVANVVGDGRPSGMKAFE